MSGVGGEDNKNTTRMTANFRRRSSATFSDNQPTSDRIDGEEATELLQDGEHGSTHLCRDRADKDGAKYHDYSIWLRSVSRLLGVVVVAIIVSASSITLFRASHLHLDIFGFFDLGSDGLDKSHNIGIDLHPINHVYRGSKTITHHWNITKGFLSPDGVKKSVYMVNGLFPGPTIECRSGDRIIVHVTNSLHNEGVSIHWHGLHMRSANSMDGAVGLTQCPISAGKKFTYKFDVEEQQSGTFWWHAHSQTQRGDGMYGGLVVHQPAVRHSEMEAYDYKREVLLLMGDWYHRSGAEVLDWYTSVKGFGNEVC